MREKVYRSLVSTPGVAVGFINTAAGLFGTFASEDARNAVGDIMTADTIQTIGIVMLGVSVFYFAALWLLKPTNTVVEQSGAGGSSQKAGDNSTQQAWHLPGAKIETAIFGGPPAPAAAQPARQAESSRTAGEGTEKFRKNELAAKRARARQEAELDYDMTGIQVAMRLESILGPVPEDAESYQKWAKKVRLEIQDRVYNKNMATWGRSGEDGETALTRIAPWRWSNARFHFWENVLRIPEIGFVAVFTDIRFNKSQVDLIWPEKDDGPQTTTDV
ncbi:hypothetical protein [Parasphingopyxis marina]|uniref:Uncharacterized protein n=1 Tax=Parasphingopyxis marina TaxID=2761622 RepID=A0A842HTV1_9SPHN|nr:hypothetical protein [Parasphingopyxis marina]MBC2776452.1 hypothetical protein [Parasphingopyxis marina]